MDDDSIEVARARRQSRGS